MTALEDKRKEKGAVERPSSIRFRSATVSTIRPQEPSKPAPVDDAWCPCGGRADRRGKVRRCTRIADAKYHADGCVAHVASKPYNPPGSAARTEKKGVLGDSYRPISATKARQLASRPAIAGSKPVFILLYEDMAERILADAVTPSDKNDIATRLDAARAKKGQKAS